jgi:hypothetical protein
MHCSTCGKELPIGVAYCPSCGSVTPYQTSSSGVSPADPTIFTSYGDAGESSQNPYGDAGGAPHSPYGDGGEPSQNPYGLTPHPYASAATAPPPPTVRRRRPPAAVIALLVVLVLLLVAGGGLLSFKLASGGHPQTHASPPATVQQTTTVASPTAQATTTPGTQTPQSLYEQVTQGAPVLDDPLLKNDTSNWDESTSADGNFSCAFSGGTYHARTQTPNAYTLCMAQASNFSDLAFQVQMTIAKGEFGGMVFRADHTQSKYYSFFIDRSGNYTLVTSVDNTGNNDYTLQKGTSSFIRTGLNQVNTLTIIARGSNIYLYINQQFITSASDTKYQAGQIGVFGGNVSQAPSDVVFSRVQVWKL